MNGITKVIVLLSFLSAGFLGAYQPKSLTADTWEVVKKQGSGNVILKYVASDGFVYYNEDGERTGVTTEIFRDFIHWLENEHEVNVHVTYQAYESWRDFYQSVVRSPDGTFGMGNVTITEQRWAELDFSPPYMTNIAALITHRDTQELTALANISQEFSHLKALAFDGTLHEVRLRTISENYFPDWEIELATSNNEIISRVTSKNEYAAYVDVYNYWRASQAGAPIRQHAVASEPSEQFGYIMPDGSSWEPIIREFFESGNGYLNSDAYRSIMVRHLGEGLADLLEAARQ